MRSQFISQTVVVCLIFLLLVAAGCGGQATQDNVQGKPGDTTSGRAAGDAKSNILGKWWLESLETDSFWAAELEFLKDGIVVLGQGGPAANYSFPEEGRIKFESPNLLRVYRFSISGDMLTFLGDDAASYQRFVVPIAKWGTQGSGDGQFISPYGIAVDGSENVYVADTGNNRVQKFSSSGAFLTKWGTQGSGDGQFSAPSEYSGGRLWERLCGRLEKQPSAGIPPEVASKRWEGLEGALT